MIPDSITEPSDLVTTRKAVRQGFLAQAAEKRRRASPYVDEAGDLWLKLGQVRDADATGRSRRLRKEILAAAGLSEKAQGHLSPHDLKSALAQFADTVLEPAGGKWREEILYRYLLTAGDTLGGAMRNVTGALAQKKFAEAVVSALQQGHETSRVAMNASTEKIKRIAWKHRLLLFDRKPRLIGKSIDVILLGMSEEGQTEAAMLADPQSYLACGELKGGIDPAGADEHWKTARAALMRVRESFAPACPALFFVGAAIEEGMAQEIYDQLKAEQLTYAANLNVAAQLKELVSWLVSL